MLNKGINICQSAIKKISLQIGSVCMLRLKTLLYFVIFYFGFSTKVLSQFLVNAGADLTICPGIGTTIGGVPAATGGMTPYTYSWAPATGLSAANIANPIANPSNTTTYTLTVTDDTGAVKTDVIIVNMHPIKYVGAGKDTSVCADSMIQLGEIWNFSNIGVTYSWSPGNTLNDSTLPMPIASPITTTTYTLTATTPGCPAKTDFVTITFIPTPVIDAGPTVTIYEGQTTTLNATGGYNYSWYPQNSLTYYNTSSPNAEPLVTTLYYVFGSDPSKKCSSFDTVTVIVLPSDSIIIYNTFTPNNDQNNDVWYIGNIEKYPNNTLEIYNRYGKLIYKKFQYTNNWNGKANGSDLPDGTYFYILDLGDNRGKKNGTVTIIRK